MRNKRARTMRRGDTLIFNDQAIINNINGEYGTVWPGEKTPPNTSPVNITGYTITFTAKYEYALYDNQAVAQLDNMSLGGVVITTAATGQFSVTMPNTATRTFADGPVSLVYDIQLVSGSGVVSTVEEGLLSVFPDVTRTVA